MVTYQDPFERLQDEVERMLGSAFGTVRGPGAYPPVNVFDGGDVYVLKAELPGIDPNSIELSVEDDVVTLRGTRTVAEPGPKAGYHRRERQEGAFRRVVRVPGRLAAEETRAEYVNGVLTVRARKVPEAQPRRVQIQAG